MALRITDRLIDGYLDNTEPGKVTGQLRFVGLDKPVTLNLRGDFHRDIRGAVIKLKGDADPDHPAEYRSLEGFSLEQVGDAGDITAGLPPQDYVAYPYYA